MKISRAVVAALALVLVAGSEAFAQCAFPHSSKAPRIKAALAQAFVPCTGRCFGGEGHPYEALLCDDQSDCDIPGGFCRAVVGGEVVVPVGRVGNTCPAVTVGQYQAPFAWEWSPKGSGSISFKVTKNDRPITPLNPEGSIDWVASLKMDGITDSGAPATGTASLNIEVRLTIDDGASGLRFPDVSWPVSVPVEDGKVNAKRISFNKILNTANQKSLQPCTSVELVSVVVKDAYGAPFAVLGGFIK